MNTEKRQIWNKWKSISHRVKIKSNRWHRLGIASEVQGHSQVSY